MPGQLENDHINTTYQKLWDVTKVILGKFIYVYVYTHTIKIEIMIETSNLKVIKREIH